MNYKKYYEKHKQTVKYAALAVILITAGGFYVSGKNKPQGEDTFVKVQESSADYGISEEDITENIYVYVCGDVLEPGVVECPDGTRMYEAVEMAGGVSECADTSSLNMAGVLSDGDRVYIPCESEKISGNAGTADSADMLVNINSATQEQLMSLPGIGSSRAADIISYRNSNGRFERIEDIMKVSGIKESAFNKIKDYISV